MKRNATAIWQGSGKEGKGHLTTQSEVLKEKQYAYSSRFEEGTGTNPEELIAAAHAGCFSMKLAFVLDAAGYQAEKLETKCVVTLADGSVTDSMLTLKASVPGINQDEFKKATEEAKKNCPISKLLNANISLDAQLS